MNGLLSRSIGRAAQLRILALFLVVQTLATAIFLGPLREVLQRLTFSAPEAANPNALLDHAFVIDLLKALNDQPVSAAMTSGGLGALLALLLVSPFVQGAMLSAARADGPLRWRALLAGGGDFYGRMLRTALVSLIPLGVAGAAAAGLFQAASGVDERAVFAFQAERATRLAFAATLLLVWLAKLTVDAGRARLAADPFRRSALLAFGAGVKLIVQRPLATLWAGASTTLLFGAGASTLMLLQLRVPRAGAGAWAVRGLVWGASALIAWGQAARLFALTELAEEQRAASQPLRGTIRAEPMPAVTLAARSPTAAAEPSPQTDSAA